MAALEIIDLPRSERGTAGLTVIFLGFVAGIVALPLARRIHRVGPTSGPGASGSAVLTMVGLLSGLLLAALLPKGAGMAGLLVVCGAMIAGLIVTSPKLQD